MSAPSPWVDYLQRRGDDADALFQAASGLGRLVFIMGDGFDPRALFGLRRLLELGLAPVVIRIPLPRGPGGASSVAASENRHEFDRLAVSHGLTVRYASIPAEVDQTTVGVVISRGLIDSEFVLEGDTVVVDVSALPTRIFFPIIGTLLEHNREKACGEVLVVVAENPDLDEIIRSTGIVDASPVAGFWGPRHEAELPTISIWAPVVGESSGAELEAIFSFLQGPDEIYPILPFPARNPRRADDLVREHRPLLFDTFEVSPRNFLYVDESNAFDLYRVLTGLHQRHRKMLNGVGEVRTVTSAHASKTLSVGACLAAFTSRLRVVTASAHSYRLHAAPHPQAVKERTTLCCMWLAGTPYK